MEDKFKEVYFNEYCKKCQFKDKKEEEYPCDECLAEPARVYSHKPLKFVESK